MSECQFCKLDCVDSETERCRRCRTRVHVLKTWPEYFEAIVQRQKRFEIRRGDRDFRSGDVLELREWQPILERYTGRRIRQLVRRCIEVRGTDIIVGALPQVEGHSRWIIMSLDGLGPVYDE